MAKEVSNLSEDNFWKTMCYKNNGFGINGLKSRSKLC